MSTNVPAPDELRHRLSWVYAAALDQVQSASPSAQDDPGQWIRLQRIVQELVDISEQAPDYFLSLAGLRGTSDTSSEHAVAVTVLVLAFGRWIGLPAQRRAELGLVALHYDSEGRSGDAAPREITAIRHLANTGRFDGEGLRMAMLIREGRRAHGDAAGPPHPFAQLLLIASDLDNLTRNAEDAEPLTMSAAAEALRSDATGRYNPAVLEAFLNMLRLGDKSLPGQALGALKLKRLKRP